MSPPNPSKPYEVSVTTHESTGAPMESTKESPVPGLRLTFNRAKDRYCFYCDDGGSIIDCYSCNLGFCYSVMGTEEKAEEDQTCVIVPEEMITDARRIFRCPECLSQAESSSLDYIINRGSRSTRRLTVKSSLVLVVFYLDDSKTEAEAFVDQVSAALCAFEVHLVTYVRAIGKPMEEEEASMIHQQLLPEGPYHLALVFLTESNPSGGWWFSSEKSRGGSGQTSEKKFIRYHSKALTKLAKDAKTARMFMISCAVNLFTQTSLGLIFDTLNSRPWHSIILPTSPALLPAELFDIFPELFVHLYYFGAELKGSLLRTWSKSVEVRVHTGFIVMNRASLYDDLSVIKLEHAPHTSRPFGIDLPMVESICGCWEKAGKWGVVSIPNENKFGEYFSFLRSSCCKSELHVAIFIDRRVLLQAHGTSIMQEEWDKNIKNFTFDYSRMVRMVVSHARGKEDERQRHDSPWTLEGKLAGAKE